MKIFIFSKQLEIAQLISDFLTKNENLCLPFQKFRLLREVIEVNGTYPDLLILDYQTFNHAFFDIYNHFERHKYNIPIVFYNEPCLTKPKRSDHWIEQINYKQNHYINIDIATYKPVLDKLANFLESPKIRQYITLIREPLPLPPNLIHDPLTLHYLEENKNDYIIKFRDQTKLSRSLFYLLEILHKNKSKPMSLEDIIEVYKSDKKQMTIDSLKVLISRLRNKIRQNPNCGFLINSSDKKYRFVYYKV